MHVMTTNWNGSLPVLDMIPRLLITWIRLDSRTKALKRYSTLPGGAVSPPRPRWESLIKSRSGTLKVVFAMLVCVCSCQIVALRACIICSGKAPRIKSPTNFETELRLCLCHRIGATCLAKVVRLNLEVTATHGDEYRMARD